jgi:hypothetical protein
VPDLRKAVHDAVVDSLGPADDSIVACTRVWEAWDFGTMTRDDFHNACEDEEIVDAVVDAVVLVLADELEGLAENVHDTNRDNGDGPRSTAAALTWRRAAETLRSRAAELRRN